MPDKPATHKCKQCGAPIDEIHSGWLCKACLAKMGVDPKKREFIPDFPASWTMDDKIAKARELGLSYGKFVALVHDGVININELGKPMRLRTDPRRVVRHRI